VLVRYGAAADRGQAALLIDSIRGFVARTAGLAGALRVDAWKAEALATEATFEVLAADGPSAHGRTGSRLSSGSVQMPEETALLKAGRR
jgi:hypothetical protein